MRPKGSASELERRRQRWNPRGETPLLRHCGGTHRKVSAIGALCVAPDGSRAPSEASGLNGYSAGPSCGGPGGLSVAVY